jgi:hypothetical protein
VNHLSCRSAFGKTEGGLLPQRINGFAKEMEEEGPAVLFPLLLGSLGKANQASWWMCLEFDVFTNTEQTKMAANTVVSFKEPHHRSHFDLT